MIMQILHDYDTQIAHLKKELAFISEEYKNFVADSGSARH